MTAVPQDIYTKVHPIAAAQGVPDALWEAIALTESGFNPRAVGDQGTSFGLFQLHKGGQLPSQYDNNPNAVLDPALNAQIAMPAIARAWQQTKAQFDPKSATWWDIFASVSGHPGGDWQDPITQAESTKLMNAYNSGTPTAGTTPLQDGAAAVQSAAQGVIGGALQPVFSALPSFGIHIALFFGALMFVIIGLWVLTSNGAGDTSPLTSGANKGAKNLMGRTV